MKLADQTNPKEVKYADVHFYPDCMKIDWGIKDWGFGQFTFYYNKDGKLYIDNEAMSKETVKLVMNYIVDNASEER